MVLRHAIVVIAAVVLAALGTVSVCAADPIEAQAANVVKTCNGDKIKLNAKEERTLRLHNRARKRRGSRPLCVHPKLTKAARAHSAQMIRKDYFGHGNIGRRLKHYGYRWRTYGENIGGGTGRYGSPGNVFKHWMHSGVHRANILSKKFREVGIGTATGTYKGNRGYTMYTVDFGTRR